MRGIEFTTSILEIKRRKVAFVVLVCSLVVGLLLFSKLLNIEILRELYISYVAIFFLLGVISFYYLNLLLKMKICITDNRIETVRDNISESFSIADVERIKIKRRENGNIREIYIFFKNRKHLFLNAFEKDFEYMKDTIIERVDIGIPICERKEPINFDHFLFYPILGLLLSFFFVFFLKVITNTDYNILKYYEFTISIFTFLLAIFFAYIKPIARRLGKKAVVFDSIIAISMFVSSIYIFIIGGHL